MGHSYGTVVAGRAAAYRPRASDVVALASPGMDARSVARLLLRRPGLWAGVAMANRRDDHLLLAPGRADDAMTLSGGTLVVAPGGLPGLHDAPVDLAWVAHRLTWLPIYVAVLGAYVTVARRFEISRPRGRAGDRAQAR